MGYSLGANQKEVTIMARRLRLEPEDIIVGLDLAGEQHQAAICRMEGERLTRFRVPHSLVGFDDLLMRARLLASQSSGRRVFAFEATGHVWEALAHYLEARGEEYVIVNPLATFRLREARQMNRHKTDISDAEQIAELVRNDLVTETKLEAGPYLELRRSWGEYARLREERARLKTLLSHQLYGVFPELRSVWTDLLAPGCLAVLRLGLTPQEIGAMPVNDFIRRAKAASRGRRLWRFKLMAVHERAQRTVVPAAALGPLARELARLAERVDLLSDQIDALALEIQKVLAVVKESRYLLSIPGLAWSSAAGILAHVGSIDKYRHGRQLIKLAGTNPSRHDTGQRIGRKQGMTHRGRSGLRQVLYMATLSCLQHNPRIRAHFDRLIQRPDRPLARMQAFGACMNKLLLYAFAVMKRRETFDAEHAWKGAALVA
jgi:transposase